MTEICHQFQLRVARNEFLKQKIYLKFSAKVKNQPATLNYRNYVVCVCTVVLKRLLKCELKTMSVKKERNKKHLLLFFLLLSYNVITSVSPPFTPSQVPQYLLSLPFPFKDEHFE